MIGWTVTIAYLATAVFYARGTITRWAATPHSLTAESRDGGDRAISALAALGLGLIWPIAIGFLRLRDWMFRPTDRHRERLDRLRADRQAWAQRAREATDPDEKRMATDIAGVLHDILYGQGRR